MFIGGVNGIRPRLGFANRATLGCRSELPISI